MSHDQVFAGWGAWIIEAPSPGAEPMCQVFTIPDRGNMAGRSSVLDTRGFEVIKSQDRLCQEKISCREEYMQAICSHNIPHMTRNFF